MKRVLSGLVSSSSLQLAFVVVMSASQALGFLRTLTMPLHPDISVSRWLHGSAADKKNKMKILKDPLQRMAMSEATEQWEECVRQARKASSANAVIRDWVILTELRCAAELASGDVKTSEKTAGGWATETIKRAEGHPDWYQEHLLHGRVRKALTGARLAAALWFVRKSSWKEGRRLLTKVFEEEHSYNSEDRAKAYVAAGEVFIADRAFESAFLQFDRARQLVPESEAATKVKNLLPLLPKSFRAQLDQLTKPAAQASADTVPLPSSDELDLINEAEGFLLRGDVNASIDALQKLLKKFPLGIRSRWARDKLYELYTKEISRSNTPNGTSVAKGKTERAMMELDGDTLFDWGKALFDGLNYSEAATLFSRSSELVDGNPRASKVFYFAGRAAQLSGKYDQAKRAYQALCRRYPSAAEFVDGSIQWGLINIELKEYSDAITHLEAARGRKLTPQQDLISLYWLFQAQKQKGNSETADQIASELSSRFMLTQYGLEAFQHINGRLPRFDQAKSDKKGLRLNLSIEEQKHLERAKILLRAGMLVPAAEELSVFSRPLTSDEALYISQVYALGGRYTQSFSILSSLFDQKPELRNQEVLKTFFPKEFFDTVDAEAKRKDLDPLLVLSVMRQESAFDPQAVSHSGAIGLLQMIPPTAEEVKKELNSKEDIPSALYEPAVNIRFCVHYLSRLIKKYDGVLPLALAAYNAGPTRITGFVRSKTGHSPDMNGVNYSQIYKPSWIDELPWSETSFYVKSILKNHLAYRILYEGLAQLPEPLWTAPQASPASSPNP